MIDTMMIIMMIRLTVNNNGDHIEFDLLLLHQHCVHASVHLSLDDAKHNEDDQLHA